MKIIPPAFEIIAPSFGSSFSFSKYVENANSKAHLWHYHPEIELVFVNGGSGKRQIGSHISYYTDGDLILIGSNLPHCGFTNEETGNVDAVMDGAIDIFINAYLKWIALAKRPAEQQ